jgi:hypothetical protein
MASKKKAVKPAAAPGYPAAVPPEPVRKALAPMTPVWLYAPDGKSGQLVADAAQESKLRADGWVDLEKLRSFPVWMYAPDGKSAVLVEHPFQEVHLKNHGYAVAQPGTKAGDAAAKKKAQEVKDEEVKQAKAKKVAEKKAAKDAKASKAKA